MAPKNNCQSVCIAGAGPAGLVAALSLARRGILADIFDKASNHRARSRATGLQAETLEILDSLGVGQSIRHAATPVYGCFTYQEQTVVRYTPFCDKHAASCDNLSLNQADTEAFLLKALGEIGVHVTWGKAVDLDDAKNADFIIAADGRNSPTRQSLGIRASEDLDTEISFGCDGQAFRTGLDHDNMHQMFFEGGRIVLVPLPGEDLFKISGTFSRDVKRHEAPNAANLAELIHKRSGLETRNLSDIFLYRLGATRAERLHKDNTALVGDAAQSFYPNGGFGLNTAMQQAYSLAAHIAAAPETALEKYEAEWTPKISHRFERMYFLRGKGPSPQT